MGVDYRAQLIYGLPSEEVSDLLDDSGGDCAYYDLGLDCVSPYYDSDTEDWIIGVTISKSRDYTPTELSLEELPAKLEAAKKKFFDVTGKEGKLYLSPHGS